MLFTRSGGDARNGPSPPREDSWRAKAAALHAHRAPETNHDRYRSLLTADDAVLFDDDTLQVGLKAEYHASEGRAELMLFYGNKASGSLHSLTPQITVPPGDARALSV